MQRSLFLAIRRASHGFHRQNDREIAVRYILRFLQMEKAKKKLIEIDKKYYQI